ncbi:MAG: glycine cleavage T C-terminal barrel domain-containing protein, partial [Betaproteobacteria bacterium]
GVTAAGGAGWQLAEWIVEGEPGIDMLAVDPRRFGAYTGKRYTVGKNEETYRNVFTIHYPDEERADARPAKTSPIYVKLDQMGAVWGQRYGWERANWFAPPGVERKDRWSFRRSNYFEHVGNECRRMREKVGVIDLTPFTKHEVSGPGSETWLDKLVANKVPTRIGRIALCHALTKKGGIRSEFTITKLADHRYYVVSAGAGERHDSDYLSKMLPKDGSVQLRNLTTSRGTFVVAGPKARDVLAKLTDTPFDNTHFPWLTGQVIEAGLAVDVFALRVNFIGELGWELHFPIEYAHGLFDVLFAAGREFGIGMVGMRAMESLRIEKSYRMWGSDLTRDYTPFEAGLERFVRMNKGEFVGKAALARQQAAGVPHRFVTLEVHGVTDADPLGNEPLFAGGALAGRATAGCYGHVLGKSLALAYVDTAHAAVGSKMEIEILGERKNATVLGESPFDPENERLRG